MNKGRPDGRTGRPNLDVGGAPANVTPLLTLDESVMHKGYDSLQINTANAEYFYHKPGGGFATLLD